MARRGALWGSFLKVWPVLIFLVPGLIGYALHQKGVIALPPKLDASGNVIAAINGDQVFPTMVSTLLPPGLRGLVVGGLMAALMSSLSSLFNSCSALFTVDIYEKIHPEASERHLVTVGRSVTFVIVLLGMAWIPVMPKIAQGGLYHYLQSVQGYLAPPITAVFLLGLFNKRINAHGAVWGLVSGFVLGMAKLTVQGFFGAGDGKIHDPAWLAALITAVVTLVGVAPWCAIAVLWTNGSGLDGATLTVACKVTMVVPDGEHARYELRCKLDDGTPLAGIIVDDANVAPDGIGIALKMRRGRLGMLVAEARLPRN